MCIFICVFKQNTSYELRIRDWSSDVCSSDLQAQHVGGRRLRNVVAEQIRTLYRYRRGHGAAVGTADDAELRRAGDAACNQIFGNRIYIVERILLELQTPLVPHFRA